MDNLTFWSIALVVMFVLYNYLIFELAGKILETPRLKRIYRIPVGLINTVLALGLTMLPDSTSVAAYAFIAIMLFVEFFIFHKDTVQRILFVVLACTIHIMAIRAMAVAAFSLLFGASINAIVSDSVLLAASMCVTFFFLNVAVILVLKFIPTKSIRIVNQHKDQLFFMIWWLVIANIYFLFNATVYSRAVDLDFVAENQLAVSIAILLGVYIVLFFTIKTGALLGYKEKNDELLQKVETEQQFRSSIIGDAITVYEVNLTKDMITKGFDDVPELLQTYNYKYSDILNSLCTTVVFHEDTQMFLDYASIKNMLSQFYSKKNESELEYRRNTPDGSYLWVKAVTNLFEDKSSGDIKAFVYIKDIHKEKTSQLELKFKAERDSLTRLYNKGTTELLISEYLNKSCELVKGGALLIIDVDNFKNVNDHFGHTFGDAVLSELTDKLKSIFRSTLKTAQSDNREDIIGRIGGDEFMVFIKGVKDENVIATKAKRICDAFLNTYKNSANELYTISASIGIALFPQNGNNFAELYKQADIALYVSKGKGKNTHSFYNGEDFSGYESRRGEIDSLNLLPQKSFHDNRTEYIFKILLDSKNPKTAIQSVLQLLSDSMNFSRGYIFENSIDGRFTNNTYEWCNEGFSPEIDNFQNVPLEFVETSMKAFYAHGKFIVKSINDLPEKERAILEPQEIKYMLQFGIFDNGKLIGFIGFDDCINERNLSSEEVDEMATLCNLLASFILKQREV